jgi:polyhydroxybutyrate depolymerase
MKWGGLFALVVLAACGDSVTGTVTRSPPLPGNGDTSSSSGAVASSSGASASSSGGGSTSSSGASTGDGGSSSSSTPDAGSGAPIPPSSVTCAGKTGATGDLTLNLTSGGFARDSLLHVPSSYDPGKGAMLVLNFHGFSSNAAEQVLLTSMNTEADARGFVVATPDGLGNGWNAGDCCTELQPSNVDDVQFTRDLLALVESQYCIDPSRVYATGMSNGGFLSHRLACALSDTIAAVAPVAGVLGIDPTTCVPTRPVPILDFHGTADPVVPYDGGPAAKLVPGVTFRSVPTTMDFWRGANACLGAATVDYQFGTATCTRWSDCAGGADVELCTLVGEGHEWPGGLPVPTLGASTNDVVATRRMVDFFVAHPMQSE